MDFDEYEYLEKMVENPELEKGKQAGNGSKEMRKDESRSSKRRIDDKESDFDSPSKRKKSERSRDRDQRGSSRHRSRSRDGERDRHRSDRDRHRSDRDRKDRDRVERNGTGRERNRDKHRDEERDRRDRSRDSERGRGREREKEKDRPVEKERDLSSERGRGREREREKEKEKDRPVQKERVRDRQVEKERDLSSERGREREKEKEMERSRRSRSRSDRPRSSWEEIDREKIRDKERERDQDRVFKDRERGSRRHKEKKEEGEEPEADPERDQRTVFAYQINLKADERHVYEFFSRAGKVRDVRLIMDRITRRSKGVGYIEFYDAMSVPMAIALSGQPLLGTPVMVKPSEAEKNLVPSTAAAAAAAAAGGVAGSIGARKLYVGNLHLNLTADQLKKIFEPFGEVELVQLPLYDTGNCKGFGFVQFARLEDARVALSLNGLEIAGRTIKVSAVTDQPGAQDAPPTSGDLDDDEGGGLSLNASTRAILMQRLDRTGTAISITGLNSTGAAPSAGVPTVSGLPLGGTVQLPSAPVILPTIKTIGVPSECLLLKNMFDPTIETEPDFDLDIMEDTREECSKYGKLKHIYVDKNTAGFVYLRFENTESAVSAQRALHGRWFAGKMITATFMVHQDYESKFPESRNSN